METYVALLANINYPCMRIHTQYILELLVSRSTLEKNISITMNSQI